MRTAARRLAAPCLASLLPRRASSSAGFAGIEDLQRPEDWARVAKQAEERCGELLQQVLLAPPSSDTVDTLDDISDELCRVMDAAELCRSLHCIPAWRSAAGVAALSLGAHVQSLNTHRGLHARLRSAVRGLEEASASSSGPQPPHLSVERERLLVGRLLLRDFEHQGVHLPPAQQVEMAALVAESQELGFRVAGNLSDPAALGSLLARDAASGARRFVPGDSSTLAALLDGAADEDTRRRAWLAQRQTPAANGPLLARLAGARLRWARLAGAPSFAALQLRGNSLAQRPRTVERFLRALVERLLPAAEREARALLAGSNRSVVQPWDRRWLAARKCPPEVGRAHALLAPRLSPGACVAAFADAARRLLDVELQPCVLAPGEAWAPGMRKLRARCVASGRALGAVYLDLVPRAFKPPGAAHYVVRCRRGRGGAEAAVALALALPVGTGMGWQAAENLFHELGHAVHSLLSATHFQHLSGTRGPVDLMEIPSHVFEALPRRQGGAAEKGFSEALERIDPGSRQSGSCSPEALQEAVRTLERESRRNAALGLLDQARLALLDQHVHGERPPLEEDPRAVGRELEEALRGTAPPSAPLSLPGEPGLMPHLRLQHLVGYPGTYYSYLYAQCVASRMWGRQLHDAARATDVLRNRLLEPGGAVLPDVYVRGLFPGDHHALLGDHDQGFFPNPEDLLLELGIDA